MAGAPRVLTRFYENKSHTDPILEDPLGLGEPSNGESAERGDPLLDDVLNLVLREMDELPPVPRADGGGGQRSIWATGGGCGKRLLISLARRVNPF